METLIDRHTNCFTVCPVCHYTTEEIKIELSEEELKLTRFRTLLMSHAMTSWWTSQPEHILQTIKEDGFSISSILDIGCGDGRWIPGLKNVFPNVKYVGIDRMKEHIDINFERMPKIAWILGDARYIDIKKVNQYDKVDWILFGGTFNPKMDENQQLELLNKIKEFNSNYILCLFDLNSTGTPIDKYVDKKYTKKYTYFVPKEYQSSHQNCVVWIYQLNELS